MGQNILLVTVTKVETLAVLNAFPSADTISSAKKKPKMIGKFVYHSLGNVGGIDVNLVRSEMGGVTPGGALSTIKDAIKLLAPVAVIMVGIAFGINPEKQKLGEILVSKQIFSYEPQKVKDNQNIYRGDKVSAPYSIFRKFRDGDLYWEGARVHLGLILSGEKLINDLEFRKELQKREPEAIGGEMEGAGLYAAASDEGVDWILVKGICDFADGNKNDDAQAQAARNAASYVFHIIQLGLFGDSFEKSPEKRDDLAPSFYHIAKREVENKKSQIPSMRPNFNLGEEKELIKIGPSVNNTIGIAQFYDNGMIVWHFDGENAGKTYASYGTIYRRYRQIGKKPWEVLGLPIGDENEAAKSPYYNNKGEPNTGRYSSFEKGEVVWYWNGDYRDQSFIVMDPLRKVYDSIGGSGGIMGFPIGDSYPIIGGERCDFEGGSIVFLRDIGQTAVIRSLLKINYTDSPFAHDWYQYGGEEDTECLSVRCETRIGYSKSIVAFNFPYDRKAVRYPNDKFSGMTERYCGLTIKCLSPNDWFRFYVRFTLDSTRPQYLEYDSHNGQWGLKVDDEEGVDYWQIPLPTEVLNGELHTLIIDLEKTTSDTYKSEYNGIDRFCFRGHVGIADIMMSDSLEAIEKISIKPIVLR